ncbi:MAG: alpha-mannosidase [Anaerolineae bacterium]
MEDKGAVIPLTIHMVGNAHIDPVWLWPMAEGRAEVLATYRTAIMLLNEFESYIFTSGGSVTYQWVEEDDPQLFAAIQKAVADGRWALVNGWWLQPDCNIPSGESFSRHALYGQRYLEKVFGKRATVGYNVDSFGHAGTLPQLLKLGGLDYYLFFRPGPHEMTLPGGPYWWEAPGGSRVLACRPPLHYPSSANTNMLTRVQEAAALAPEGQSVIMCFYGVGNHGGGPTRRNVSQLLEIEKLDPLLHPVFSTPEHYFETMTACGENWPKVKGELQHHARGCYAALSRVKRENRLAEHALMAAERMSTIASVIAGQTDDQPLLAKAWHQVLFNQFHDIMAGTSIREAYEDVWRMYAQAQQTCQQVTDSARTALQTLLNIRDDGQPLVVWNSLPWERRQAVQFAVQLGGWHYDWRRYPGQPLIKDESGNVVPSQLLEVEFDHNSYVTHIEAQVTVPALGAKVLYLHLPDVALPTTAPEKPTATVLENEFWHLTFDATTGSLTSLYDLKHQVEMLSQSACVPIVIDDPSDTWSHDVKSFRNECGRFTADMPPALVHQGPTRQTVRVHSAWGNSTIVQEYTLRPGQKEIEMELVVDWHEQLKMLKLAFPLAINDSQVTASAPYGHITRQANGEEEPCQAWVDLSGSSPAGQMGLCVINDSKYGYDALDNELRLSILRSPIYAFHDPRKILPGVSYHYIDQGLQTVRCLLLPHIGDWRQVNPARRSFELQEPLQAQLATAQTGQTGELSFLDVSPENVVLCVVKLAEDGGQLLVRGYETEGRSAHVVIKSSQLNKTWSADIGPHEIWTLALPLDVGAPVKLSLLEEPLA